MKKVFFVLMLLLCLSFSSALACDHEWSEWRVEKKSTCLEEGRVVRVCLKPDCGTHDRTAAAKLPHVYSTATCTKPSTCLNGCEQTRGTTIPHSYAPSNCITKETCTMCGTTRGELGAHNFSSATCLEPEKCTICGMTSGGLDSHKYSNATCLAPATCSVCGVTTGGLGNHLFSVATCEELAYCLYCNTSQQGEHRWVEEDDNVICSICGMYRKRMLVIGLDKE